MVICISTVRRLFQLDRQLLLSSHELISVFLLSGETYLVNDEYLLFVFSKGKGELHSWFIQRILGQPKRFNKMFSSLGKRNRSGKYKFHMFKLNYFDRFPSVFLPKNLNEHSVWIEHCLKTTRVKPIISDYFLSRYTFAQCRNIICPYCNK